MISSLWVTLSQENYITMAKENRLGSDIRHQAEQIWPIFFRWSSFRSVTFRCTSVCGVKGSSNAESKLKAQSRGSIEGSCASRDMIMESGMSMSWGEKALLVLRDPR